MALEHIMPNRIYSAQELYAVSEGQPFGFGLKKWKLFIFRKKHKSGEKPLRHKKGSSMNSAYLVKGDDFLDFTLQF